jgi:hypothetical protein
MQPINLQLLVLNKRATQAYFPFDHAMLPCSLVQACSCSALHFVLWHCITFVVLAIPDGRYALLVPIFVCIQRTDLTANVWTMDAEIVSLESRGQTFQWAQIPQSQEQTNRAITKSFRQQHVQDPKSRFSHHMMILQRVHSVVFAFATTQATHVCRV